MKIRFLADADLNLAIVTGILRREPSVDFLTASQARLRGLKDPEVLQLASNLGRVIVSHDASSMPLHFRHFHAAGGMSPGIFLIGQHLPINLAIEELLFLWSASDASDWHNRLVWLPL